MSADRISVEMLDGIHCLFIWFMKWITGAALAGLAIVGACMWFGV
jgi:hypothetical protein